MKLFQRALRTANIPILVELLSRGVIPQSEFNVAEIYNNCHNSDIVRLLVTKGADVNASTPKNYNYQRKKPVSRETVLMMSHSPDFSTFLIENGADVNLQNSKGQTALMFMEYWHKYTFSGRVIPILIENGAETTIKDKEGNDLAYYRRLGDKMGPPV